MRYRLNSYWMLVALIALFGEPVFAAGDEGANGIREGCGLCGKRVSVPLAHIGLLEIGMVAVATATWPEGYNLLAVRRNTVQLKESWTRPPEFHFTGNLFTSDNDWWYFNVFAHGLFGSEAYLSARVWGHGPGVSGLLAVFASFSWEYLVEAWYKRPSAIDLFWTPLSGILLGELRFRTYLAVTRRVSSPALRKALQILLDPLGSFERRLLGCEIRPRLCP
jgi:hypothetical protein